MEFDGKLDFAKYAKGFIPLERDLKVKLDFKNAKFLRNLTCAILKVDFKLSVEIPLSRLIPAIPSRLEYLDFIDNLVASKDTVYGLDIGTGASAIYPLLGAKIHHNWVFECTEIDDLSIEFANENILRNNLQSRIVVKRQTDPLKIFSKKLLDRDYYDFCMCNPPFYKDQMQIDSQRACKELDPFGICTGSEKEMICEGGEIGFVQRMMDQSRKKKKRFKWFTCLIGKKQDALDLVKYAATLDIEASLETFRNGQTSRWIIFWTFYKQ